MGDLHNTSSSTGDAEAATAELPRHLGFTSALAIGVGTMIAAGIFTLSGLAVQQVGSGAIVSFIIAACVALMSVAIAPACGAA